MASISKESNGRKTIQFVGPDGKRRSVRLGKQSQKDAEKVATKIELIAAANAMNVALDRDTAEWLGELDATIYARLVAVGLVPERVDLEQASLGNWLTRYIAGRSDVKGTTATVYSHTKRNLIAYFGASKMLSQISQGDADEWRLWLAKNEKLGDSTVRRRCGIAKQFFRAAVRKKVIAANPFGDMKGISSQRNAARQFFISREVAQKVIDACPDAEWRLLFALSRFGGLRCPSEHLALRWSDIDWEHGRMLIRSPKTEHHEGGDSRMVPIFPELRPHLEAVWEQSEPGTFWVITGYRQTNVNLRTQLYRILKRAGLPPWPKLFQNLRSTRETELADVFPIHVVCQWIGNSQAVAKDHYLQVTNEHFSEAIKSGAESGAVSGQTAVHKEVQPLAAVARLALQEIVNSCDEKDLRQLAARVGEFWQEKKMGGTGLEPVTPTV